MVMCTFIAVRFVHDFIIALHANRETTVLLFIQTINNDLLSVQNIMFKIFNPVLSVFVNDATLFNIHFAGT